jgi:hypothetical protein
MLGLPVSHIILSLMEGGRLLIDLGLVGSDCLLKLGDGWHSCRGDMGAEFF